MAIEAGDELNKDGIQNGNQSYEDKVKEQTEGREGEVSSLGEILNSVDTFRNLKKSCEFFPNLKVENTLMTRLKGVFASRGLGEPRKDMMIMSKDVDAIVEIIRTFTDELIQDISNDFNGLVLTKSGRINEEATREQAAAFNMQHPGEEINVDAIPATYFSRTNESIVDKEEGKIIGRTILGTTAFSMKDIDFEKVIEEAFYKQDEEFNFGDESLDEWFPEVDKALAEKKIDEAMKELTGTKEEKNSIHAFMNDPRNQGILEELEYCLEVNKYGISLNDKGRIGMIEIVSYYREQFAQDPSVLALPASQRQAKIDELVDANRAKIMDDVFDRQKYINSEMANKAGIATADEVILLSAINLSRNMNDSPYDKKRFYSFVQAHPDFFRNREFNEETQSYFTREEIEYFEEKQRCSHAYKIQKSRDDALMPDRLSKEDKSKTIKRLLYGLRRATSNEHFDSIARADYLSAIAKISGRDDIIDWETGRINEDAFYEFYGNEIDDEPVTISELADQGLSEITYEFERFLNRSLTDINMGTWQNAEIDGVEDENEIRKAFQEAAAKNTINKRFLIISMAHPANYREAKELSFISNVIVGDSKQNEKMLKKDPTLRELLDEDGNLTKEAAALYKAVFESAVFADMEKINEGKKTIETPLDKKEALELVALGMEKKTGVYSSCIALMEKIFPEAIKKVDGEEVVDEEMLLEEYNKLVKEEGLGDQVKSLRELRRFSRDRLSFKYDKHIGVIYDFFRDRVEREDAAPEDELLGVIALAQKEAERKKKQEQEDKDRLTSIESNEDTKRFKARRAPIIPAGSKINNIIPKESEEEKEKSKKSVKATQYKDERGVVHVKVHNKGLAMLASSKTKLHRGNQEAREHAKKTLSGKAIYLRGDISQSAVRIPGIAPDHSKDIEEIILTIGETPPKAVSIDERTSDSGELTIINDIFEEEEIETGEGTQNVRAAMENDFKKAHELLEKMRRKKREDPNGYRDLIVALQKALVEKTRVEGIDPQEMVNALHQIIEDKEDNLINDSEMKRFEETVGYQQLTVLLGGTKSFSAEELYNEGENVDSSGSDTSSSSEGSGKKETVNLSELTEAFEESEITVGEVKASDAPTKEEPAEEKKEDSSGGKKATGGETQDIEVDFDDR